LITTVQLIQPSFTYALDDLSDATEIPIIGLNENNESVVKMIPMKHYQSSMTSAMSAVQDSMIPALESNGAKSKGKKRRWRMDTVGVGIGLSATIGLGPIVSVSPSAHLRLVFTRSPNPVYPD